MVELALATPNTRQDGPGEVLVESNLIVEKRGNHSAFCKWNISSFAHAKQKTLWSKYFEVGGYDCRLLVYPTGDSQALPGYVSVYLQISDPGNNNSKWDCFASYRLSVRNLADESKSVHRDSWHRFSAKKKSHGWCDFAALTTVLDPKQGFLGSGDTIQISTDITILHESVTFTRESDLSGAAPSAAGNVYSGKFVWRVHNFSAFQPLLKTQKIMSPGFPAGDCLLRLSVYQSTVTSSDYLSVCLESKDTEKAGPAERSCWCLFRLAVASQSEAGRQVHRDSYGRFAADSKAGDNTSLGWNDFMRMSDFLDPEGAYLVGDTAVFSTSFHVIREYTSLTRNLEAKAAQSAGQMARYKDKRKLVARETDFAGKFTWRIEHFTRLKDLLKKRKITGLCIKSKRFSIGGRDCRLIVYPRGQSQPPTYLSMFLEVCDPRALSPDWTCFVSHRLAVVNQRAEVEKSVSKESQNRYSKTAKDWGWREFVSLTTLFDADAGFLVNDAVVFAAEVLVLRESSDIRHLPLLPGEAAPSGPRTPPAAAAAATTPGAPGPPPQEGGSPGEGEPSSRQLPGAQGEPPPSASAPTGVAEAGALAAGAAGKLAAEGLDRCKTVFTWRIENFQAFKDIMETRKIFSRFFSMGPCELRIGLYESFESLCLYLESDSAAAPPQHQAGLADGSVAEKAPNYWVRYRMAVLNQRHPERTEWKEAAICTRSWNNSVLQFMRIPHHTEGDVGYVLRDSLVITCEVLECCPWLDFAEGDLGSVGANGPMMHGHPAASAAMAAADKCLSLTEGSEADDEDDGEDVYTDEDDDEDGEGRDSEEEGKSEDDFGDDEDALSGWLASAGVELSGGQQPPVVADPPLVRRALAATLLHQPGAVPMFIAALRMYMDTLAKVKCLLLPSPSAVVRVGEAGPASPHTQSDDAVTAGACGASLMHVLMGLPQLQQPLLGMLLDVMLDHCLTARMHRHHAHKASRHAVQAASAASDGERSEPACSAGSACSLPPSPTGSAASTGGVRSAPGAPGSSGYSSEGESSYEDAFEAQGAGSAAVAAAGHWAQDALLAAKAAAAAATGGEDGDEEGSGTPPPPQQHSGVEQRPANGVLRGLTPLPPRKQQPAVVGDTQRPGEGASPPPEQSANAQGVAEAGSEDREGDVAACHSSFEVEQVVGLILGWLRGLDPSLLHPLPTKAQAGPGSMGSMMRAPLSSLQKVSMLLADAPRHLQPDIILLVPRLVDPSEHTAAAGTLLGRLAEASREGSQAEGELRMPVLAALGMLRIDPAVADKVLHAALEALPCLSDSELPPAVGLVLKLASESNVAKGPAVRVVRQRMRAAAGGCSPGALDAVRLAVLQHSEVAKAMLQDIESDAREALALSRPRPQQTSAAEAEGRRDGQEGSRAAPAGPTRRRRSSSRGSSRGGSVGSVGTSSAAGGGYQEEVGRDAAAPGPATLAAAAAAAAAVAEPPAHLQLQLCDCEVLLDLLSIPDLQRDAVHALESSASGGILHEADLAALLERRRLQQLVSCTLQATRTRPSSPPPSIPSSQQQAQPSAVPASAAALDDRTQQQVQQGRSTDAGADASEAQQGEMGASDALLSALNLLEGSQYGLGGLVLGGPGPSDQQPHPAPSHGPPSQDQPHHGLYAAVATAASAALPPDASAALTEDLAPLVAVAEGLLLSPSPRSRSFAMLLYRTLFRLYSTAACHRHLLRGLVHIALGQAATPRQPSVGTRAAPSPAGAAAAAVPTAAAHPSAARAFAEELLGALLTEYPPAAKVAVALCLEAAKSASQQAEQLLRQLAAREASAARDVAAAREDAARLASSKDRYSERVAELETQVTRLRAEHRAELAGQTSDKKELQSKIRHLETQLEWVRSERDDERASKSKEGREAAQRALEAEAQLTRLKTQRREEQKRWQKEKAGLADRVKELEERQRAWEAESARLRTEVSSSAQRYDKVAGEMRRRAEAAEKLAAERDAEAGRAHAAAAELEAKLRAHQEAVRKLEKRLSEEVARSAAVVHGSGLDALKPEELEALGRVHEQGLKRVNQALTKRGRPPLASAPPPPGPHPSTDLPLTRSSSPALPVGGAPTPVPSAAASPMDPGKAAYRPGLHPHQHQHQLQHVQRTLQAHTPASHHAAVQQQVHQHAAALRAAAGPPSPAPRPPGISAAAAASLHAQLQSLGAAGGAAAVMGNGGQPPRRPASLNSSLDSLQSLGSANSLFAGPWGSAHSMAALQQAAAAAAGGSNAAAAASAGVGRRTAEQHHHSNVEPSASAAMDAANMEKLMGLLPSDLLHS